MPKNARNPIDRRTLIKAGGVGLLANSLGTPKSSYGKVASPASALAISSANGLGTVEHAVRAVVDQKMRPVSAAVRGVAPVEADPDDLTVGLGGLPNEQGVVQLDAACMDGPVHNAGSVACLEGIVHPAQVAELVMDRTDHVNLVGKGALQFALDHGFEVQDLLTEKARNLWLQWRARRTDDDRLLPMGADGEVADELGRRPWGTIHCSVLDRAGDVGCCTTTSGLAFKIPGRIGDSPLIGCGLFCDNEVGSAGATGRGEAAIHSGGSWLVVERMRAGDSPEEACLFALRRVAEQAERQARWQPALWDVDRPSFGLTFYAIRKDGQYGSATMRGVVGKRQFAVCDEQQGPRHESCTVLFPDSPAAG